MGVLYRAQHMNLQRRGAIKIIAPEFADTKGFRSRFIREARIAAGPQHPNGAVIAKGLDKSPDRRRVGTTLQSHREAMAGHPSGSRVRLTLARPGGKTREVELALA